jgi:hypothetical protein
MNEAGADLVEDLELIQELCGDATRANWSDERNRELWQQVRGLAELAYEKALDLTLLLTRE